MEVSGAECIAYHFAVMMTTDLKINVNKAYSVTDIFDKISLVNEPKAKCTRSSVVLSLDWLKRAFATKWARTAVHKWFPMLQ